MAQERLHRHWSGKEHQHHNSDGDHAHPATWGHKPSGQVKEWLPTPQPRRDPMADVTPGGDWG